MSRFTGPVRQNGYVVRDVEASMRHWVDVLGVGPFFYIEKVPVDWFRHRGVAYDIDLSIALANSGDLQIELIQQRNDVPSLYREFAARHGEGLQHMSWWSTTYQADYDAALARGLTVGHEGQINGPNGRFVYFDTDQTHPGTVVELSDVSGTKMRFFDHIRRAAVDWDGSDPIRPVK